MTALRDYRTGFPVPSELQGKLYSPKDLFSSQMDRIDAEFAKAMGGKKPPRLFSTPAERCGDLDRTIRNTPTEELEEALGEIVGGQLQHAAE